MAKNNGLPDPLPRPPGDRLADEPVPEDGAVVGPARGRYLRRPSGARRAT